MFKYITIIQRAMLLHLVIHGMQWPILMAWGYAIHPLACLGNFISLPCISALLAICTVILICFLCGIPCAPALSATDYVMQSWLWLLHMPLPDVHVYTPCPHWSVLCSIPIVTWLITVRSRTCQRAIGYLISFFTITGFFVQLIAASSQSSPVHNRDTLVYLRDGSVCLVHHTYSRQPRYTDNWIRFHLLPTLRREYGREQIDYIITASNKRPRVAQVLASYQILSGKTYSIGHICGMYIKSKGFRR